MFAGQDLLALEVAAIGNHLERVDAQCLPGLARHVVQLAAIIADVGHFMSHDQVVLGIHRRLYVVAHHAAAAATGGHRAGIGVGQGDLLARCFKHPGFELF